MGRPTGIVGLSRSPCRTPTETFRAPSGETTHTRWSLSRKGHCKAAGRNTSICVYIVGLCGSERRLLLAYPSCGGLSAALESHVLWLVLRGLGTHLLSVGPCIV